MKSRVAVRKSTQIAVAFTLSLHLLLFLILRFSNFAQLAPKADHALTMEFIEPLAEPLPHAAKALAPTQVENQAQKHVQKHVRIRANQSPGASLAPGHLKRESPRALNHFFPKIGDLAALSDEEERQTVAAREKGRGDGVGEAPVEDDSSAAWGAGSGEFKRVEDYGLMRKIYERTDDALFYPSVLAAHQISGTVKARLIFTLGGECDWQKTSIQATDSHLRIYILSVLKGVCHQNFAHFLRGRKTTNVDLFFDFAITERNDKEFAESRRQVFGNVLAFYRNSQQSVAEWHLGPFKGIFPVPAVAMDFAWLSENWDRVVNDRDPLKEADKDLAR